jgi:peptidoglycan hydrolase-like protein with peptidoglycan-binding domain
MQALAAHTPRRKRRLWLVVIVLGALVVAGVGAWYAVGSGSGGGGGPKAGSTSDKDATSASHTDGSFAVVSTVPSGGATDVASNATLTVRFSSPLATGDPDLSLNPPVAGRWERSGDTTLVFHPSAPFVPSTPETLTIPGNSSALRDSAGQELDHTTSVSFTVATGSTQRLQQLLAQLGFLPLAYVPPNPPPAPQDLAEPQPGTLTWRWTMPSALTGLWFTGEPGVITKGAIMSFEDQNGLTVDGLAGPKVWAALLSDVAAGRGDTAPYSYVLVTKTLPEHLTLFDNGSLQYTFPVNTGAPGATTPDGTFEVFEHVKASDMKGTNITGSTYTDPTVPWASYFHTGDALHGFVRAQYGFPQSNGCVEMPIADAAQAWPLTPIGTLVTVTG